MLIFFFAITALYKWLLNVGVWVEPLHLSFDGIVENDIFTNWWTHHHSDEAKNSIQENIDEDDGDDDDGPPPGWEFVTLMNALPESPSKTTGEIPWLF